MNARQERALRSIETTRAFFNDPERRSPRIDDVVAELEALHKQISATLAEQTRLLRSRGATGKNNRNLRRDLRKHHLLPIANRGKQLLKGLPGIEETLRVPHARARDQELLDAAARIAKAVKPHAAAFTMAKFSRTFITELESAARVFGEAAKRTDTAINQGSRTTMTLREQLAEARRLIAALDSLVYADHAGDKEILKLWRLASRIPAKMGRPRTKGKGARSPQPPQGN